jgi:hypothetical protein
MFWKWVSFLLWKRMLVLKVHFSEHEVPFFISKYYDVCYYANLVCGKFTITRLIHERCLYNATFRIQMVAIRLFQWPV